MKRLILLITFILVAIGFGVAIYFVFFRAPEQIAEETAPGQALPPGTLPGAKEGKPASAVTPPGAAPLPEAGSAAPSAVAAGGITKTEVLNATATLAPMATASGALTFYDSADGKFYEINAAGKKQALSSQAFVGAKHITWAPNQKSAIIEFPDDAKIIYNFEKQKQTTVPNHWEDFSFAPDGSAFVGKSLGLSPENRWLIVANPDGTGTQAVAALGENAHKVIPSWSPNNQVVAFSQTAAAIGFDRQEILLVGKNEENFRSLTVEGLGFQPQWSPSGAKVLYSAFSNNSDYKPVLWMDAGDGVNAGTARQFIGLQTWADKCTFASDTALYCAVPDPNTLPIGIGFTPDQVGNTNDSIYKVDLQAGLQTIVGKPDGEFNLENLQIAPDGSAIYFTDKETGVLRSMKLK